MFSDTISGVRRTPADRDQRRIGDHGGLRTHVRPRHRTLGCREPLSSGSESFVAMVETADLRERHDLAHAGLLNRSRFRRVLAQRQVRPVVVGEVGVQDPVQVPLTEDEHGEVAHDAIEPMPSQRIPALTDGDVA